MWWNSATPVDVDENSGPVFSVREFVLYMYNNGFAAYINEPIIISYSKHDEYYETEFGSFSDFLNIKDIEFFRIESLEVQKI